MRHGELDAAVLRIKLLHEKYCEVAIDLPGFRFAVATARNQTGNDDVPVHVASDSLPKGSDG